MPCFPDQQPFQVISLSIELHPGLTAAVEELVAAANITDDPSADQWREVLDAVFFNGKPAELACLDELGSRLMSAGLINAAYAW